VGSGGTGMRGWGIVCVMYRQCSGRWAERGTACESTGDVSITDEWRIISREQGLNVQPNTQVGSKIVRPSPRIHRLPSIQSIMAVIPDQAQKPHRAAQSGKKAEKKDIAQGKDKTGGHKGFNEKVSKRVTGGNF
jgi:hypothetical protein